MILLLTRTDDIATDVLVLELERLSLPFVRINTDLPPQKRRLSWTLGGASVATPSGERIALGDVTSAWCRKTFGEAVLGEGPMDAGEYPERYVDRESLTALNGVVESVPLPCWMNHPSAIRRAEHKLLQLRVAAELGFDVPETLVSNDPDDVRAFTQSHETVAKTIRAVRVVTTSGSRLLYATALDADWSASDEEIAACVTIYQARVPKRYDIRVTMIGKRAFGTRISSRSPYLDWRAVPPGEQVHEACDVPADLVERCVAMMHRLALRYGAFDFSVTPAGAAYFLEVNPGGQWAWLERATGAPMTNALACALRDGAIGD